tara:strand:- start:223 stop:735 length:513 start_codon:yes stop_codon:yes gene_type:complete
MKSKLLWFTGLSGSGKTTLGKLLNLYLKKNYQTLHIDGDIFRKKKKTKFKLSRKNIINNNIAIINMCKKSINKYDYIIVSAISPLRYSRNLAKKTFGNKYIEFLVKANISDLFKRDTKLLYKRAREENFQVLGYNSKIKYEFSKYKTNLINTSKMNKSECLIKIKKKVLK